MKVSLFLLAIVGSALAEIYFEDRFDKGKTIVTYNLLIFFLHFLFCNFILLYSGNFVTLLKEKASIQ